MNILTYAIDFAPKIGGEATSLLLLGQGLARRFARTESLEAPARRAEDSVTLVTRTSAGAFDDSKVPFRVVRQPTLRVLWRLFGEADVVQVSGPVFLALLLGLVRRKRMSVLHHTYHSACPNARLFFIPADSGGLGEVADRVGLKFPAGDLDSLTEHLRQVLDDRSCVVPSRPDVEAHCRIYSRLAGNSP